MRLLLVLVFSFGSVFSLSAQTWEVGGFAGSSGYMGDINPLKPYKFTDLALGGLVKRNIDGYWSFKLSATRGTIRSDDAKSSSAQQQQRNLNFYSALTEVSLQTEFNLFNYLPGILPMAGGRRFSPFLFTGVGGVLFNPKTNLDGTVYELPKYVTESADLSGAYKKYAVTIPYGAGVKYNIKGNWNLVGELGYRTAFTDYLDDVSGKYPELIALDPNDPKRDLSDPSNLQIGLPGTQRGDFRKKDTYMFAGFSLTYTFVSRKCPMF
jgi:hypothetical protein